MSEYAASVSAALEQRYANQPEYLQAVQAWLEMIQPAVTDDPRFERLDLLTRMVEPERMLSFTVPWVDDQGMAHTNHGYRVQFNSAIGPYKGGLRFHPTVNPSVVKFLGFEQTYKNALTALPIGGAAGGADFDPRGKSNREIMRFCQSFMTALYRHIGSDTDIPAGDIGVGAREIGYLFGEYKRLTGRSESSALTGKGLTYGGSKIRQEAAGFGTVYFLARMMEQQGETLEGKRLAVSGFGNMSWGVCRKSAELGGKVVTLSGPDGYVYDPDGVTTQEKLDFMLSMRAAGEDRVEAYADRFGVKFYAGKKPWEVPVDIAVPCATQNELDVEDAVMIVANNVRYYVEAANMPATAEALKLLRLSPRILTAGSKASGSGGVVVSALEMVQNSVRYSWSRKEVDDRLRSIMNNIYDLSAAAAAEYDLGYDLIAGSDIAAFKKISEAMIAQGL
ncbi:NADP-specific glutamate dehydrogenase [Dysosmobacter sp.]|uniref:NADP-specific glutamate dehydrogenase n=1 Tax=Dysosmobacter sp. TaxID=2591382 RepID=UPI00260B25F3|nr:NADP-specific glutamate dehydrogenase [Dysosmobacter sp.]